MTNEPIFGGKSSVELAHKNRLSFCHESFTRIWKKGSFGKGSFQRSPFFRKSVVSIKFPPVILGPEMAAPILWAPGIFWFFLLENPHAHKIPPFGGGVLGFSRRGGWKCQFYFYGRGDFSEFSRDSREFRDPRGFRELGMHSGGLLTYSGATSRTPF